MARDRGGRPPPTQQSPWQFTAGGRVGLVVVRRGKSDENDIDRLQKGLSPLSRTRTSHGLGLYVRVSGAQVGDRHRNPSEVREVASPRTRPRRMSISRDVGMSRDMGMSREMGMSGQGGEHLCRRTSSETERRRLNRSRLSCDGGRLSLTRWGVGLLLRPVATTSINRERKRY